MSTITISPGADIQKVIDSAASGTTVVFTSGTYDVSNVINLKSGVSLEGQPGAELLSNGSSGIFRGVGVQDITISGFIFDGHNGGPGQVSGAIYLDSSTGDNNGTPSNNINILNNTFQNWTNSNDLWLWRTQNTYIEGNTLKNGYEGITWATDPGSPALNNLVISGNTITGMQSMAIETAFSSTISNIHIDYNNISNIKDISLSFVEGPTGGNFESGTVWGNHIDGTNSGHTLLELGDYVGPDNITVANNVLSNAQYGMMFSHAAGAAVLANTFTNVQTPFSEDGGYDGTEWIGGNTVDGVTQNGWSAHGAYGTEPALYSPLSGEYGSSSAPTPVSTDPAPSVTQAAASPATGIEHAGNTVTLMLGFNEAVTVTGTPTLSLNDGGTATYVSGSGTSALTFRTTVASTDTNTSALAITGVALPSGASIKDASGAAADLSGAVKTFSGLQIDPILPAVTQATASPATGIEHAGDTVTLTLGFNEAVTVTGTPSLSLNDGGTATYVSGSGTSALTFRTTVASTDTNTSALAITGVALPSGAGITDASGVAADLSGAVKTFSGLQIDPILPAVTQATASPATGTEHVGDTVTLTLGFNEAVTVTGTPTLALNDGDTATYVSGSGTSALTFRTTVASTDTATSALGITGVNLPSGAGITDASGVAADLSGAVKTFSGLQVDPTSTTVPTSPVPTASSTAPTLSVANNSLTVTGGGGTVGLGLSVTTTDPNDAVTVNITGLPKYETITDNLDGHTYRGKDITLTEAQVDSGLTLQSNYRGSDHPVATLTVTATGQDPVTSAVSTSAAQTITVIDPPPATAPTTASLANHGFALLSQYLAGGPGQVDPGQIVEAVSHAPIWQGESFLTKPQH